MLCQQCHERNATIHLCMIVGDKMTKRDLCEVCGAEYADPAKVKGIDLRNLVAGGPEQMMDELLTANFGYAKEAYQFVRAGLDRAQKKQFRETSTFAHVSGREMLEALRELAVERFGKQAKAILNGWGVFKCEDFGEIVFNLIEAGMISKQQNDLKADFAGGYNFDEAFPT